MQSQLSTVICDGELVTGALLIGDNICEMSADGNMVNISNRTHEDGKQEPARYCKAQSCQCLKPFFF